MVLAEGSDKCVVSETAGIGPSYISVPGPLARPLTYPRSLTAGRRAGGQDAPALLMGYGGTGECWLLPPAVHNFIKSIFEVETM